MLTAWESILLNKSIGLPFSFERRYFMVLGNNPLIVQIKSEGVCRLAVHDVLVACAAYTITIILLADIDENYCSTQ